MHAGRHQGRRIDDTRSQLQIRGRAGHRRYAPPCHQRKVLRCAPDAVCSRYRQRKHAAVLKILRRRHAIAGNAFVVLALGLGQVQMQTQAMLACIVRRAADAFFGRRVFRVDRKLDVDQRMAGEPLGKLAHRFADRQLVEPAVVTAGEGGGEIDLHSRVGKGFTHRHREKVHVRRRNRPAARHLHTGQQRAVIDVVRRQLVLGGENTLGQPTHQRQIFPVAAQNRHR